MTLATKDISLTLSGKQIIRAISLRVDNGAFVSLLGPNGSGKSTFLRCVYKALHPDDGSARLDELDVLAAPNRELARRLAVVSQFQELNFDFSVRQMVLMGRTPFKKLLEPDTAEDIDIVNHALEEVGLDDFGDRSYSTLSGGEKQRVVLARAIAQTPGFMILDEPTNHLDIKYQLKIMSTVKSLGVGVLAAMHDLSMAAMFSSYICLLKEGQVVAQGIPQEILTREVIREVYEVDCLVAQNPENGRLSFTYLV
jgi:iron complex transport system ATP-binding protein